MCGLWFGREREGRDGDRDEDGERARSHTQFPGKKVERGRCDFIHRIASSSDVFVQSLTEPKPNPESQRRKKRPSQNKTKHVPPLQLPK